MSYWSSKLQTIQAELNRNGLANFRGEESLAGLSFADNLLIDARLCFSRTWAGRLCAWLASVFPMRRIFDAQRDWARAHALESVALAREVIRTNPRVAYLLHKYKIPESTRFGCLRTFTAAGESVAISYLEALDEIAHFQEAEPWAGVRTMAEIGGGFGRHVHLTLTNFPAIRKVLYIDIQPVLTVGEGYLRSFYGDSVSSPGPGSIRFANNDNVEILCITPDRLEETEIAPDLVTNFSSFLEMPRESATAYAEWIGQAPMVCIEAYTGGGPDTIPVGEFPDLFGRAFQTYKRRTLLDREKASVFMTSKGKGKQ